MSSNIQNLQSLLHKPATQTSNTNSTGSTAGTLADVLGKGAGNDSQTFAKLMSQYQSPQATARSSMPTAAASTQARNATEALRANTASQAAARAQQARQSTPAKTESKAPQPQQSQQATKQAQKSNTPPKQQEARAKAKPADGHDQKTTAKADAADKASAKGDADKATDEVKFSTAQGEGAAQVKELQPPPDVSTSDPAAMMAWLASLSQNGEAAAAAQGDSATADGATGAPDLLGAGRGGKGIAGGPGALPTGTAALTSQLADAQHLKGDAKAVLAANTESLGTNAPAAAAKDSSSPLEFNALMARELSRPAGTGPAAETSTHATATLPTPVDSADFKQALAERVGMWVSGTPANGQMTAELRLNPQDMGPVHIRIVMDGQNAQVDFAAAHAETRQAIEASLPALSTALQDAGLSLAGGGVSDQSASQSWAQQQQGQGEGQARSMAWSGRGLNAEQPAADHQAGLTPVARPAARPGGLDLYA